MNNETAHFLIPFESGMYILPQRIVADVTKETPFTWYGKEVNTTHHKTWIHYIIQGTPATMDALIEEEIAKLDAIKAPYYMIYAGTP